MPQTGNYLVKSIMRHAFGRPLMPDAVDQDNSVIAPHITKYKWKIDWQRIPLG